MITPLPSPPRHPLIYILNLSGLGHRGSDVMMDGFRRGLAGHPLSDASKVRQCDKTIHSIQTAAGAAAVNTAVYFRGSENLFCFVFPSSRLPTMQLSPFLKIWPNTSSFVNKKQFRCFCRASSQCDVNLYKIFVSSSPNEYRKRAPV